MTFKKALLATGFVLAVLSAPPQAQSADLDPDGVPYSSKYYPGSSSSNVIALVRKPGLSEDQFALRITDKYPKTGCAEISNYAYSAEYRDVYLDINLDGLTIDMRNMPQYAHYECSAKNNHPYADIIINKSDLKQNQTQKIRMSNGTTTNYFTVTYTDDMVKILPDSQAVTPTKFTPQSIPHKKTSLVYWFYPVGTLVMWAPGIEKTKNGITALNNYAERNGLVPLESIMPGFESPSSKKGFVYYVDTSGDLAANNTGLADGTAIGTIKVEKKVYGLEKDEIELDELTVYAKKPGMYD